jgi:hypothetical protein
MLSVGVRKVTVFGNRKREYDHEYKNNNNLGGKNIDNACSSQHYFFNTQAI